MAAYSAGLGWVGLGWSGLGEAKSSFLFIWVCVVVNVL